MPGGHCDDAVEGRHASAASDAREWRPAGYGVTVIVTLHSWVAGTLSKGRAYPSRNVTVPAAGYVWTELPLDTGIR